MLLGAGLPAPGVFTSVGVWVWCLLIFVFVLCHAVIAYSFLYLLSIFDRVYHREMLITLLTPVWEQFFHVLMALGVVVPSC